MILFPSHHPSHSTFFVGIETHGDDRGAQDLRNLTMTTMNPWGMEFSMHHYHPLTMSSQNG